MKALLIFLLAGNLLVQSAGSLKCYKCTFQTSNSRCRGVTDCGGNAAACRTDVLSAIGVLNFITKTCSQSCKAVYEDYIVAQRNVSCCHADLCNLNGAVGLRASYAKVGWAVCTSFVWTLLWSGP